MVGSDAFNYTGLLGFVVKKLQVVSGVILTSNPESESAYRVRILRYLRLCARKMGFFATFEVMYMAQEIFLVLFLNVIIEHYSFPSKCAIKQSRAIFSHKDTAISGFDIYPNNLMSIHIDFLVHTILHSKIYIENLCLRVLMVCE